MSSGTAASTHRRSTPRSMMYQLDRGGPALAWEGGMIEAPSMLSLAQDYLDRAAAFWHSPLVSRARSC